jgi:RNA polymerase sigma factor (sigma-70 family)
MMDDQTLLLHYTRSLDAEAFSQLVQRYSSLVFSVACRVTGNAAIAEDVTQDCFLKLSRQAASSRGSLPAWLHRVALNRSLQVARNEATRKRHEAQVSPPADSEFEPSWNQIAPLVDAALAKLPDNLRESLVQHFLLGRTQAQIAENMHIDQATVSRRLTSGAKLLREHLKKSGVVYGTAAMTSAFANNASAAVPSRLTVSLAKMALAGPTKIAATVSIAAILAAKAKLIAVVAAVVIVGTVLTYNIVPLFHRGAIPASTSKFTPRPYLSKLEIKGDGYRQDSFSLAFQAAANVLGRDADYETIYALSTNAFSPAIYSADQYAKNYWHVQSWLGDKAINTIGARFGLKATKLDPKGILPDAATYRIAAAPSIMKAMDAGKIVLIKGWGDGMGLAGIITDANLNGVILGAGLDGRQDNPVTRSEGILSLESAAVTLTPHEADIATLRSAVARIRSQTPFKSTPVFAYGLKAMDFWIKEMSEKPGFCAQCMNSIQSGDKSTPNCASLTALTTQTGSAVAARYLRRIAPDFPSDVASHIESAARRYDHIVALLTPALAETGPDSYSSILGDLSKQKAHTIKVLTQIKNEYSAIAQDLELALSKIKPQ